MAYTSPILDNHLNLKTYWGEEYEVYKDSILYKDFVLKIPKVSEFEESKKIENFTFELGISNACNLGCKYCFANHEKQRKFKAKEHINIIKKLVNHFGEDKKYIFFLNSDGEILTSFDECCKIVNYCKENGYWPIVRSNGTETNIFQNEEKLKKLQIDDYSISYDGEHTTERVFRNGESSGKIVRDNIKYLCDTGRRVQVNIVVTPFTESIYDTITDLKSLGVHKIMITQQKDKEYSDEEFLKVYNNFKDFYKRIFSDIISGNDSIFNFLKFCDTKVPTCSKEFSHFFKVDKDLNLSRCSYIHNKIKLNKLPKEFFSIGQKLKCNDDCLLSNFCAGNFCAGLSERLGCELRKLYFEFLFNIALYYKENQNIDVLCSIQSF